MQRRPLSVTGIHSIGRLPGSGYITSSGVHATSNIWLTVSAIARACDRLIVAPCFALICPSTCVGIIANLHRLQIITLYSGQCTNNLLNCSMANLWVGDFSFVLTAGSYTPFTPAAKRFRVLKRLLLRHPVAYVARSWNFILLVARFSTLNNADISIQYIVFSGPMGMKLLDLLLMIFS